MKKIIYAVFAGVFLLCMPSCKNSLELNPTSQPSEGTFWKTEKDFDLALAGIYGQIRSNGYFNELYPLFDNLTDNSYDKNGVGNAQSMARGEIDPTSGGYIPDIFSFSYSALARVNQFIERAEANTTIAQESKKRLIAEAKFFRGYYHMWLYLLYGDVPIVTHTLKMDKQYLPKESADKVYAQVIADYDEAIAALPDVIYAEAKGHITKGAVKTFKAKVLLQHAYVKGVPDKEELKQVIALLESVHGYSLQPKYVDLFNAKMQESSPEIIFSIKNLAPSSTTVLDMVYTNWLHTCPLRNLVDEFELEGEGEWKGSTAAGDINEDLINNPLTPVKQQETERSRLFVGRDRRLKATIFHSLKPFSDIRYIEGETDYTGFGFYKYLQYPINGDLLDGAVSEQDMIHMRYAYVLLMIAEAENEINGATAKAYNAINSVRLRAGQKELHIGLSQDELRKKIRHEWRVETAFEGLHYFEMKRWYILKDIEKVEDPKFTDYKPSVEERFYLWPLPQTEIEKSNGTLVQNPNYN